jgi:hypothetical protein
VSALATDLRSSMKNIIFILLIIPLLQACSICSDKKATCPGYSENGFSNWFPYLLNQVVIFKNNAAADTLSIRTVDISPSYSTRVSAGNPYCTANKEILGNFSKNKTNLYIQDVQQTDEYSSSRSYELVTLSFKNVTFDGSGISDTGLVKKENTTYSSQYFTNQNIGSSNFQSVQLLVSDTTTNKTQRPYKVWISKNNGIIAYEEYPSHDLWIKQ